MIGVSGAAEVATSLTATCVRLSTGGVVCAGQNLSGELGNGSRGGTAVAGPVSGLTNAISLDAVIATFCAIRVGGTVVCWGAGNIGQLGHGSTPTAQQTPVIVSNLNGVTRLDGHPVGNHWCALRSNGTVWCWGAGSSGRLGNNSTVNQSRPVQVSGLSNVVGLAVGSGHSCAIERGGALWCWGTGSSGQLGNGLTANSSVPVRVF